MRAANEVGHQYRLKHSNSSSAGIWRTTRRSSLQVCSKNTSAIVVFAAASLWGAQPSADPRSAFAEKYCAKCHNDVDQEGGFDLTFSRFGAAYLVSIECFNPETDKRCLKPVFIRALGEKMGLVGKDAP